MYIRGLRETWYVEIANRKNQIYSPQLYKEYITRYTKYPTSRRGIFEEVLNIKQ